MKMNDAFSAPHIAPATAVGEAASFPRRARRFGGSWQLPLQTRCVFLSVLAICAIALSGCQTPHQFATPDKTWKTHIGQLKYADKTRTLIGDVVVQQRGAQDFQLEFQKAGGISLLTLREDATTARAEGLFARGSWQGAPSAAPRHLRNWVALREAFLNPIPYPMKASVPSWKGEVKSNGGQLTSLSLTFPTDEQQFVFQFNR